jgi:hypothetical protein
MDTTHRATDRTLTLADLLRDLGVADDGDALPEFWD